MFYIGIIEDARNDPLQIGRVRVRILNYHSEDKEQIPTEHLPWAQVMQPTTSPANSGLGHTPFLLEGTQVIVYFIDGNDMQVPVVMGTIAGINNESNRHVEGDIQPRSTDRGFSDPNGVYPLGRYFGESDLHKLARSDGGDVIATRKANRTERDVDTYMDETNWDEPDPLSGQNKYPYNIVRATRAGHVEEWDDTPGNERIHTYHRSGTSTEIQPNGDKVTRVVNNDYEIVADDKNVYIKGNCNLTVDSNVNTRIKGDYNVQVDGNFNLDVGGDKYSTIAGKEVTVVGDNSHLSANQYYIYNDVDIKGTGNATVDFCGGNISLKGHNHPQNSGNHFGGGTSTSGPSRSCNSSFTETLPARDETVMMREPVGAPPSIMQATAPVTCEQVVNDMELDTTGLDLIQQYENEPAFNGDDSALATHDDGVGILTGGWGHVIRRGDTNGLGQALTPHRGQPIPSNLLNIPVSRQQANAWLMADTQSAVNTVNGLVTVRLNQLQFDALVSLVYNIGQGNFANSTLLELLNSCDYEGAANEFGRWVYSGGQRLNGLVRRRAAEAELFRSVSI